MHGNGVSTPCENVKKKHTFFWGGRIEATKLTDWEFDTHPELLRSGTWKLHEGFPKIGFSLFSKSWKLQNFDTKKKTGMYQVLPGVFWKCMKNWREKVDVTHGFCWTKILGYFFSKFVHQGKSRWHRKHLVLAYISPEKTLPFGDSYPISHVFLTIELIGGTVTNVKISQKTRVLGDLNCCCCGDEGILSAKISVHKNGGYVLTYISCIWEMALFSGKTQWENPPTPPKRALSFTGTLHLSARSGTKWLEGLNESQTLEDLCIWPNGINPRSLTVRPWKMVVGRRSFPIGKVTFQGLC